MIGYGLPEQNELIQAACQETGLEKHRVKVLVHEPGPEI